MTLDHPSKGLVDASYWMIAWRTDGTAASGPLAPSRPLHLLSDTLVWRLDTEVFGGIVPSSLDSIRVMATTRPEENSLGDFRNMMVRRRPGGCYEVGRSRSPSIIIDEDGYPVQE
jgi:hypothetical protein